MSDGITDGNRDRGMDDILASGAAWITEKELAWLGDRVKTAESSFQSQKSLIERLQGEVEELRSEGRFLLNRLADLEHSDMSEDTARDFHGHVMPSISRFSALLDRGAKVSETDTKHVGTLLRDLDAISDAPGHLSTIVAESAFTIRRLTKDIEDARAALKIGETVASIATKADDARRKAIEECAAKLEDLIICCLSQSMRSARLAKVGHERDDL